MSRFFGDAVHAAYVVPDIKAAMQAWLDLGCGPIYLMDHVNPDARYRGVRNNPCISAAILNSGSMQIELLQPHVTFKMLFNSIYNVQPVTITP